jgi:hypothetical protein
MDWDLPLIKRLVLKRAIKKIQKTWLGDIFKELQLI